MIRTLILFVIMIEIAIFVLAMGSGRDQAVFAADLPEPGEAQIHADPADLPELFVTADRCMACHNGLIAQTGEDVSIGANWRSSMMAHAARDPYWHAAVRRETLVHPTAAAAIEHECSACHMPMNRFHAKVTGGRGRVFDNLPVVQQQHQLGMWAADGVSCTMCHQIRDDGFGEKSSFTAGFAVDTSTEQGQRPIYGPFEVDAGRQRLMNSASFYLPVESSHVQSSELCATCHTLFTHALNDHGEVVGELPEQVPYLEWKHSSYAGTRSCQDCHMPEVEGPVRVSGVLGEEREGVSRHAFRGGNFFMPRIFNAHRAELGVKALPQELAATSLGTVQHLETSSARLSLENVVVDGDRLRADVHIANLAGHKLPSAYPSRRVWVCFTVTDGAGETCFESGRPNPDGSISGNDNDSDPGQYEPHYAEIDEDGKVQIYEAIMAAPDDTVTTVLLSAVRYLKDNRLLPEGFDKSTASGDIAVLGSAVEDDDFTDGSDRVRYTIPLSGEGPFTVRAELWYQPIAFRWAQNLSDREADEIDRFVSYYNSMAEFSAVALAGDSTTAE